MAPSATGSLSMDRPNRSWRPWSVNAFNSSEWRMGCCHYDEALLRPQKNSRFHRQILARDKS
jgi:hypothetical protein